MRLLTPRRRRLATAVGVVLLVGTPLVWRLSQPPVAVGDVPGASQRGEPTPAPLASPTPSRETTLAPDAPASPAIVTRDATLGATSAAADEAPPGVLRIPSIDVEVPIVPVGVTADGEMEVPADVRTAGWYRFGPVPGAAGSAVVAGHVDSRTQGLGAFHRLRELAVGATVEVVLDDGTVRTFRTVARRTYDKTEIPLADVFARDGAPQLALITCGGDFDRSAGHYRSNVVVYAVPDGG